MVDGWRRYGCLRINVKNLSMKLVPSHKMLGFFYTNGNFFVNVFSAVCTMIDKETKKHQVTPTTCPEYGYRNVGMWDGAQTLLLRSKPSRNWVAGRRRSSPPHPPPLGQYGRWRSGSGVLGTRFEKSPNKCSECIELRQMMYGFGEMPF